MKRIISLILYNHDNFSLKIAGNKYNINGYKRLNMKLEIESLINAF